MFWQTPYVSESEKSSTILIECPVKDHQDPGGFYDLTQDKPNHTIHEQTRPRETRSRDFKTPQKQETESRQDSLLFHDLYFFSRLVVFQ